MSHKQEIRIEYIPTGHVDIDEWYRQAGQARTKPMSNQRILSRTDFQSVLTETSWCNNAHLLHHTPWRICFASSVNEDGFHFPPL